MEFSVAFYELCWVIVVKAECFAGSWNLRVVGHVAGVVLVLGFRAKRVLVGQVVKQFNNVVLFAPSIHDTATHNEWEDFRQSIFLLLLDEACACKKDDVVDYVVAT